MKKYNISADIIRILAVFFVVFSHSTDRFVLWTPLKGSSISWDIVYYMNTLSRVAVPLFVILSGYLLLKKEKIQNVKSFYKRRLSKILLPFIIWLSTYYAWAIYWDKRQLTPEFISTTLWHGDLWHLWFIVLILELYLIAPILIRFISTKSAKKQTILFWSLICFSIFCSILVAFNIDVRRNIFTLFFPYIGIFYAGAYLRNLKITKIKITIFAFLYFILAYITNLVAKGNMTSSFIVFNYSPTLLPMTIFLFLILKDLHHFLPNKFSSEIMIKIIPFISSTTFGIYFIHLIVLDLVQKYFHLLPWELTAPLAIQAIYPSVITFSISFAIVASTKKLPFAKYIWG